MNVLWVKKATPPDAEEADVSVLGVKKEQQHLMKMNISSWRERPLSKKKQTTPPDEDLTEVDMNALWVKKKTTPPDEDLTQEVDVTVLWVKTTTPDEDLTEFDVNTLWVKNNTTWWRLTEEVDVNDLWVKKNNTTWWRFNRSWRDCPLSKKTTPPDQDLTEVDLNELWVKTTPFDEDLIEVAFQLPVMKAHTCRCLDGAG